MPISASMSQLALAATAADVVDVSPGLSCFASPFFPQAATVRSIIVVTAVTAASLAKVVM